MEGCKLTCQKADSYAHVSALFALDETPSIVELGLGCDMASSEFGFVLRFEDLKFRGGEGCLCVRCVRKRHGVVESVCTGQL